MATALELRMPQTEGPLTLTTVITIPPEANFAGGLRWRDTSCSSRKCAQSRRSLELQLLAGRCRWQEGRLRWKHDTVPAGAQRMYSDVWLWKRIRTRVLVRGESVRSVALNEGIARNTVRKMLRHARPPGYRRAASATTMTLEGTPFPYSRYIDRPSDRSGNIPDTPRSDRSRLRWMNLLYDVERGCLRPAEAFEPLAHATLIQALQNTTPACRPKVLCILGNAAGFSSREIARHLALSRNSVHKYIGFFKAGGVDMLLARKRRPCMADDEALRNALFALLHEPPSASGINRTSWKLDDLRRVLQSRGHRISARTISKIVRSAGYRWKSAKVVLTSTDAHYEEKLRHIKYILGDLQPDERFFSIDEFGPFAVKMKPGRMLIEPGVQQTVPQWQKSKGCLIVTAALELSSNQMPRCRIPRQI